MATTAATSGNERKARVTILGAGNIDSNSPVKEIGVDDMVNEPVKLYPQKAVSSNTANIGTIVPLSGLEFNNTRDSEYVMPYMTTKIAGSSNTTMRSPAGDFGQIRQNFKGDTQLNITSWNAVTGAATQGGAAGANVLASGSDGTTGTAADTANAMPGNIYFLQGGKNPVEGALQTRND